MGYKCLDYDGVQFVVNPTLCAEDACFRPWRRGELGVPLTDAVGAADFATSFRPSLGNYSCQEQVTTTTPRA